MTPARQNVMSRKWAFYVNSLAASPLVSRSARRQIYRRNGLDVQSDLVYPRCYFHTADLYLGPEALLNHGVHIDNVARVEIGARSSLGVQVAVITSNHDLGPRHRRAGRFTWEPVTIGTGCWIGARAVVLPGVTIGDGCLVAAGAVVTADCQDDGLYAGVPARRIRDLDPGEATAGAQ